MMRSSGSRCVDGVEDAAAIDMFRAFVEDVGPGYLTGDAEQAWERAMVGGVARPFAGTAPAGLIPRLLPEFLNDHLAATFEGEPEGAHAIAETMGRLIRGCRTRAPSIHERQAMP